MTSSHIVDLSLDALYYRSVKEITLELYVNGTSIVNIVSYCVNPYFFVRFSGNALVPMQRVHHYAYDTMTSTAKLLKDVKYRAEGWAVQYGTMTDNSSDFNATLSTVTMAPVPVSGIYFVEILHLECNSTIETMRYDCLPRNLDEMLINRIFALYLESSNNADQYGYWFKNEGKSNVASLTETRYQNLYTGVSNQLDSDCRDRHCDVMWLRNFRYVHDDQDSISVKNLSKQICFVGASHSDRLAQFLRVAGFRTSHILCTFPRVYLSTSVDISQVINNSKCDVVIIALGQWPLSFKYDEMFSNVNSSLKFVHPDTFLVNMRAVADHLFKYHANLTIAFRSIHYNALGYRQLSCPRIDFRSPAMVDAYNEKLRTLSETHQAFKTRGTGGAGFQFIDTSLIMRAIWDSPPDYCHYDMNETIVEGQYMIKLLLLNHTRRIMDWNGSIQQKGIFYENMSPPPEMFVISVCALMTLVVTFYSGWISGKCSLGKYTYVSSLDAP
jgi:hypothetical protein